MGPPTPSPAAEEPPPDAPLAIPAFYRILFSTVDPLLGLIGGVLLNLVSPASTLNSYTPLFTSPPAPETTILLASSSGFFAGLAFLQLYLLRARPADLVVWRALQGALIAVDAAMFAALVGALVREGRVDKMLWRAEDWVNMVMYPALLTIRLAFVSGVGMDAPGDLDDDEDGDEDEGKDKTE